VGGLTAMQNPLTGRISIPKHFILALGIELSSAERGDCRAAINIHLTGESAFPVSVEQSIFTSQGNLRSPPAYTEQSICT